jgi:stage V sporulation protein AF
LPPLLAFLDIQGEYAVPILVQLFLTEFAIDGLKLASLNTPSMLNNSLSIIGGLILGDLAVSIGFLAPQVIFYMAFVAIGNFSQPNYELGYAFKFMRLIMLALIALFDTYGLVGGFLLTGILLYCNQTVDGARRYLYPLIPFDAKRLKRVFSRRKVPSSLQDEKSA